MIKDDGVIEVEVTTESGKPPRKKFPNAKTAWATIEKMIKNQEVSQRSKARIQGLCDGNPPYNSTELRRLGQGWRSNVNFREAESIIDNNASAYWELIYDTASLVRARIDNYDKQDKADKEAIIADEFSKMILGWEGFFYEMAVKIDQMLKMGRGVLYWKDPDDWRFQSCKDGSFLLPKRARCNIEELNAFGIRDIIEVSEAYDIAEDDDGIYSARGWNISYLRKILVKQFEEKFTDAIGGEDYQEGRWLDAQQKLRNGDWNIDEEEFEPLKIVHFYCKEATDKVSHYILSEIDSGEEKQFLLDGFEELDSMPEAIAMFFYHFGDGYAEGVKGLGHRIFPHVEVSNRLTNGLFDGALMAGSLVLQPPTGDQPKNVTLTRVGPVTIIPTGHQPVQSSFQPPLNHMIAVRNLSQGILSRNSGIYDVPDPDAAIPVSATEAKLKEAKEARFSNNQVILFYIQWDRCLREIYRRCLRTLSKDYPIVAGGYAQADNFIQSCLDKGVTKEMLEGARISAQRAIGLGSPSMRRASVARIFSIRGALPDYGKYNALRDVVAAEVGYDQADRYVGPIDMLQIKDSQDWQVLMEENDMHDGYPVMVTDEQNQFKHFRGHVAALAESLQALQQQGQNMNLEKTAGYLQASMNHLGAHMQVIGQDPGMQEMVKQAEPIIKQAQQALKAIVAQLQRQAQQRAQQQQRMAQAQQDMTPEMYKAQVKSQLDAKKAQDMADSRNIKVQSGIDQAQQRTNAEIERLARKTEAEIQLEILKEQNKV